MTILTIMNSDKKINNKEEIKKLSLKVFSPLMKETFDSGSDFIFSPTGNSMLPLLRGTGDYVVLRRSLSGYYCGDIVLFMRKNGNYILHRIVEIDNDGYVLCGDGQKTLEKGIQADQIIARVHSFYRYKESWIPFKHRKDKLSSFILREQNDINGKHFRKYNCQTSWCYLCYCHMWRFLYPVRRYLLLLIRTLWPIIKDNQDIPLQNDDSKTINGISQNVTKEKR